MNSTNDIVRVYTGSANQPSVAVASVTCNLSTPGCPSVHKNFLDSRPLIYHMAFEYVLWQNFGLRFAMLTSLCY